MVDISARGAITVNQSGEVLQEKNPDDVLVPMSIVKFMTGYLTFKWYDNFLDEVEVLSSDTVGGTSMRLRAGDLVSIESLLYGLMLPSGNDAGQVLGRVVGERILELESSSGDGLSRFVQEMNDTALGWGWENFIFTDSSGHPVDTSRMSARQVADMFWRVYPEYPEFIELAGTLNKQVIVDGPNARTLNLTHSIRPDGDVKFPEFISGKTGAGFASHLPHPTRNVSIFWNNPSTDEILVTSILGAGPNPQRYLDLRRIMNHIIGAEGLLRWGSKPPIGMSFNGRPVTSVKHNNVILWP